LLLIAIVTLPALASLPARDGAAGAAATATVGKAAPAGPAADATPAGPAAAATTSGPAASAGPAGAPTPAGEAPAASTLRVEAPVRVANRTVTRLRGTLLGVGPLQRAERAQAAIDELQDAGGPGQVTLRAVPQGQAVLIDGQLAMVLVAGDVDVLADETLAQASAAARDALQLALDESREARNLQRLLGAGGRGLLATAIAAAILWGIWFVRRRVVAWVAAVLARRHAEVRVAGAALVQTERLVAVTGMVARGVALLLAFIVVYDWLGYVLSQFPYSRPWGEQLTQFLVGVLRRIGLGVLNALPDLVVAALIFVIARTVIVIARPVFTRPFTRQMEAGGWLDADTAKPTQKLFNLGVALFALVMAYPYLPGSDSEAFKGLSVLVGLMLTLGGSSLVGQAISGLVLMYSRTMRVGDFVRIGEHEGTVTSLGTFTIRVRTGMGDEITLPNAHILGTVTKNYSRPSRGEGFVVDTAVTIGYDTPWRQVEAMLLEAALRTPGVLADPPPRVFQTGLGDFYPEYRLTCLASPREPWPRAQVMSMLHGHIQDVFNEHGVQIMSPHYLGDPAQAKVVPPADWYRAPANRPPAAGGGGGGGGGCGGDGGSSGGAGSAGGREGTAPPPR
jgi:small-conductance mechanosensitive channel